jgi:hypothetical protein
MTEFRGSKLGERRGGRKKGTPNKMTKLAKEQIAEVAGMLGGAERMYQWVKQDPLNERVFWSSIYTKLLPRQIGGDPDGSALQVVIHTGFVYDDDAGADKSIANAAASA